jgi:hypothetical protein
LVVEVQGHTADVPIGEAVTGGGTSGALPGQDTYYTSDGGTDSDQTGALPDTTVSGQPKKRIPRWSDLFLGNLARDLNKGFAATPPPAAVPRKMTSMQRWTRPRHTRVIVWNWKMAAAASTGSWTRILIGRGSQWIEPLSK